MTEKELQPIDPEREDSFSEFFQSLVKYHKYLNRFGDPTPGDGPNDPMTFKKWSQGEVIKKQISEIGDEWSDKDLNKS